MIKQLITWLYERYCQEEPFSKEKIQELRAKYEFARGMANPFYEAAWKGLPKPPYPLLDGKEVPQLIKNKLDAIYESSTPKAGTLGAKS
jgi:hypothetical protein